MLNGFVGQENAIEPLRQELTASAKTGRPLPHMLFLGPPGTGKTTLAKTLATELNKPFEVLHGPNAEDRATITDKILAAQGGILYIEEIHAVKRQFAEDLFTVIDESTVMVLRDVMEKQEMPVLIEYVDGSVDFDLEWIDAPTGRQEAHRQAIDPVTIIGSTTDEAQLPPAFLSRLSALVVRMQEYSTDELIEIARTYATDEHGLYLSTPAGRHLARRCRQNPRRLKQLVDRAAARAVNEGERGILPIHAMETTTMLGIDKYGLEEPHRKMLRILTNPVSRTTLAQKMGIPAKNVDLYFGELVRLGFAEIAQKHQVTEEGRKVLES